MGEESDASGPGQVKNMTINRPENLEDLHCPLGDTCDCDFKGKDHGLCDKYQDYLIDQYTEDYGEEEHAACLDHEYQRKKQELAWNDPNNHEQKWKCKSCEQISIGNDLAKTRECPYCYKDELVRYIDDIKDIEPPFPDI